MREHRGLRKSAFRSQKGDFERVLVCKTGGHDFPEQPQHLLVAQRALIALERHAQHLGLALRLVEINRMPRVGLRYPDELRKLRALVDERVDFLIDRVDPRPHVCQLDPGLIFGSRARLFRGARRSSFFLGHRASGDAAQTIRAASTPSIFASRAMRSSLTTPSASMSV